MSYILDALRKSEQERQAAAGQSASALYPVLVEPPRPGVTWAQLLAVLGVLGIVAALSLWWWTARSPVAPIPVAAPQQPPAAVVAVAPPLPVQEVAPPTPVAPVALDKPRATATRAAPEPAPRQPAAPEKVASDRAPLPVASPPPTADPPPPPELPPLRISGYVRDSGEGGMAMINDKLVREGEEVSPGLRLEKILPDGAVFNYKGHRFTR